MTASWASQDDEMTLARSTNAVVVAHPDDEALWLSSVVASADRIVFGFGDVFNDPRSPRRGAGPSRRCR